MSIPIVIFLPALLIAAVLGGSLAYLFAKVQQASALARLQQLDQEHAELDQLRQQTASLQQEHARLAAQHDADQEKLRWKEKAENELRNSFNSLAAKALHENSEQFLGRSKEALEHFKQQLSSNWNTQSKQFQGLIHPLDNDLKRLDKQIQDLESKRSKAYGDLDGKLQDLMLHQKELRDTTSSLNQALRSSQVQGKWGEVQLRRIVELAGLNEHVDFDEQKQTSEGSRPDMVVRLPNEGSIPVDAKSPMGAYLDAQAATTDEERKRKLTEHATAVRQRINELGSKKYWEQFERAPQFVVMLIPYESGLGEAFRQAPALYDEALQKKVVVASPGTLLALLKVVAFGWMQLELTKSSEEIGKLGRDLSDRMTTFIEHFNGISKSLSGAVISYNKAVGSLENRVYPTLRRFKELGVNHNDVPDNKAVDDQPRDVIKGME